MKASVGKGKKALSVLLSAMLVAQMYGSPAQVAYAQATQNAALEQAVQDSEGSLDNNGDDVQQDDEATQPFAEEASPETESEQSSSSENVDTPPLFSE